MLLTLNPYKFYNNTRKDDMHADTSIRFVQEICRDLKNQCTLLVLLFLLLEKKVISSVEEAKKIKELLGNTEDGVNGNLFTSVLSAYFEVKNIEELRLLQFNQRISIPKTRSIAIFILKNNNYHADIIQAVNEESMQCIFCDTFLKERVIEKGIFYIEIGNPISYD